MKIRRLTASGLTQAEAWLDQLTESKRGTVPAELVSGDGTTEATGYGHDFAVRIFTSRLDWGIEAERLFREFASSEVQADKGLWTWLTLVLFDQVCPPNANGVREVGQRARYVPSGSDYRTYYRHLLEGPWRIVRAHRDDPGRTRAVLAGALNKPGELYEQIASRQDLVSSSSVIGLATELFIDPKTGARKRGAGGRSPRRLADVLMQFDVTYDIYGMGTPPLVALLPNEFDRFKRPAAA